jgi:hypothetical protein
MAKKLKCKTCLGEYNDVCADGLAYYHTCPPVTIGPGQTQERANKRDENIVMDAAGKNDGPKATGSGVDEV